jgi:hypothetical protein
VREARAAAATAQRVQVRGEAEVPTPATNCGGSSSAARAVVGRGFRPEAAICRRSRTSAVEAAPSRIVARIAWIVSGGVACRRPVTSVHCVAMPAAAARRSSIAGSMPP